MALALKTVSNSSASRYAPAGPAAAPVAKLQGPSVVLPRLLDWAHHVLTTQIVRKGDSVCHVFCGRGQDAPTWISAQIRHYTGIDISESALSDAREEWERAASAATLRRIHPPAEHRSGDVLPGLSSMSPSAAALPLGSSGTTQRDQGGAAPRIPPCTFFNLDPCLRTLQPQDLDCEGAAKGFDVVCCSPHVQDCFLTSATASQLASNVGRLLRPGGYFFGLCPDSSSLWYKFQRVSEAASAHHRNASAIPPSALCIRSSQYVIAFESSSPFDSKDGSPFGIRYSFRFADEESRLQQQCLMVHFPTFIRLLEQQGLEYIEIQNLEGFYEDHRTKFQSKLSELLPAFGPAAPGATAVPGSVASGPGSTGGGAARARIPQSARDLLALNAAFVFRKRLELPRPPPQPAETLAGDEGADSGAGPLGRWAAETGASPSHAEAASGREPTGNAHPLRPEVAGARKSGIPPAQPGGGGGAAQAQGVKKRKRVDGPHVRKRVDGPHVRMGGARPEASTHDSAASAANGRLGGSASKRGTLSGSGAAETGPATTSGERKAGVRPHDLQPSQSSAPAASGSLLPAAVPGVYRGILPSGGAQSDDLLPMECDPDRLWLLHAYSPQVHLTHMHQEAGPGWSPLLEAAMPAREELLGGCRLEDLASQRRNRWNMWHAVLSLSLPAQTPLSLERSSDRNIYTRKRQ